MIAVVLDGMDLTDAQWAVLEPRVRALQLRAETAKRVSFSRALLAARCAEVSESEETFHGFAYQEGVVAWSSILSVVFRILLRAHLVAF